MAEKCWLRDECCSSCQPTDDSCPVYRWFRELLKGQEAIAPILGGQNLWLCGKCGTLLGWEELAQSGIKLIEYKYCPGCGRKVKWND